MEPDYQFHKFDFFKTITKKKYSWRESSLTTVSFCIFMSSFILPVAYFQNYKHLPSHATGKVATVMKCDNNKSEIICYTEETVFKHTD